ncbi:tRNA (N6-threonylcarbamoyladenosine(37)-N6)-methyltransferase TrmO [Chloroflexota bacterium]
MADNFTKLAVKAIGIVRNELKEAGTDNYDKGEVVSEIVLDSNLTEALDGIEEYSHIIVLWWMHLIKPSEVKLKTHPMGRKELPLKGLFALRTPNRPNPIGKTTVRLLHRKGNRLIVKGLEALDGSPVIDIKPYICEYDSADNAKVPQWIDSLS